MPYVSRSGNAWVCWGCIGGRCSSCINKTLRTAIAEMRICDCEHPASPGWVLAAQRLSNQSPVITEHHDADTGPVPVIRQGRSYATPWHTRKAES